MVTSIRIRAGILSKILGEVKLIFYIVFFVFKLFVLIVWNIKTENQPEDLTNIIFQKRLWNGAVEQINQCNMNTYKHNKFSICYEEIKCDIIWRCLIYI